MHGSEIAYLHHEGLTDMKPILNRGIGKRLRGGAFLGAEMHQNEAFCRESLRQNFKSTIFFVDRERVR